MVFPLVGFNQLYVYVHVLRAHFEDLFDIRYCGVPRAKGLVRFATWYLARSLADYMFTALMFILTLCVIPYVLIAWHGYSALANADNFPLIEPSDDWQWRFPMFV